MGKSSILEAISGIELPRAQNICTRCPLELRMKHAPPDTNDYATIRCAGLEETLISDLSEISTRVVECTNFLTGNLVAISSSPIFLTVYRKDIQDDLTLVDLPGENPIVTIVVKSTFVYFQELLVQELTVNLPRSIKTLFH